MAAIIILFLIYILIYSGFIFSLVYGFRKVADFKTTSTSSETTFSVIVPFRNEDQNLQRLLNSLADVNYPTEKFELIFVDDFSDDFSANVINKWRLQHGQLQTTLLENLRLTASPKKDAISRAVPIVRNNWIVTTDADCKVPANWLRTLDAFISANSFEMIAAPVLYEGTHSFRHHFERLDMMSLQGATIGGFGIGKPFMCNGANFAYTKNFFHRIGGFNGNSDVASGDDVFLLQKAFDTEPRKVGYLKSDEAIVTTKPADSLSQLLHQRVRWASKSTAYAHDFAFNLALVVFLGNLSIVAAVLLGIFDLASWFWVLALFSIKCIPDFWLLTQSNRFLRNGKFFFPLFSAAVYPFFSVIVASCAVLGNYKWKGRTYRK